MGRGLPFENAYEMVKKRIGLHGLQQIQEDTLSLIDKKYRIMKNTMKIFGVIAPILMAFGSLFKIEHWPGAGILLTLGFFLLCFVFLPSAVYVSYREVSNRKKLLAHLSGFLAGFLFAISFLFKIQHWPFANVLMLVASIITGLVFIPAFFVNQLKECPKSQRIIYVFGFIGSLAYLAGFLLKFNHWSGASISILGGTIFLILIAFPLFIISHYKNYEHVSSRFIFLTFAVIWFVIPPMLVALNISKNALIGLSDNASGKEYTLQYLTSKNNRLFEKFEAGLPAESIKIKESAANIKKNSDGLVNYIQNIKFRIINLATGEIVNPKQPINLGDIDPTDKESSQQVLLKEGEAKKLIEKLDVYRIACVQNTGNDDVSANLISEILTIGPTKEMPEADKIWEHFNMITTLNKLSTLQEKVRMVEKIVFRSLTKKTAPKQLLISLNQ